MKLIVVVIQPGRVALILRGISDTSSKSGAATRRRRGGRVILSLEERPLERREEGSQGTSKKEGNERVEWVMKERALSGSLSTRGGRKICAAVFLLSHPERPPLSAARPVDLK